MKLSEFLKNSKGNPPSKSLVIIGVNPIIEEITSNPELFYDMLVCSENDNPPNLKITIIYESDDENFNQSLFYDKERSKKKVEFDKIQILKKRLTGGNRKSKKASGFIEAVQDCFPRAEHDTERIKEAMSRLKLFENNRGHKANIIKIDDVIWYSITLLDIPTLDNYNKLTKDTNAELFNQFSDYIDNLLNVDKKTGEIQGNIFLSKAGDELIQLYDNDSFPRGIAPRKAFYSTEFQRYSVWAFIFNRKGQLLLHKRSETTQDNRALWDKSAGGHVDLTDSSTVITAKRELVEEMFLPEAEYTKYMSANVGDIIDFGEWNLNKREEKHFIDGFKLLDESDWVVFRATDYENREIVPMTIRRKSPRKLHIKIKDDKGNILIKNGKEEEIVTTQYTRFISDVFLFIAPDGYIDNESQMNKLLHAAEIAGAASAHKLVSIDELVKSVEDQPDDFTDDVVYMCSEKKKILVEFSEAIKFIFQK
ncbi:MAG: hypothetical protein SCALA702_01090 [Melioribacteraceae bacterium]|nr:MAG: hypothetical protein SCALA702_01090 [Melioribacteraceae bacterium]